VARIRRACTADLNALVAMGRAMHAESPRYRAMDFDPVKVRAVAGRLMAGDAGMVFLATIGERWFGPDRYVTDLVVYVRPEHRGGSAFFRLVCALEGWAAQQGVLQVDLGVSTGVQVEQTVRAYERLGYTLDATRVVTKKLQDVHRT
jgi:GNAT superfamily N-acetyltransferase